MSDSDIVQEYLVKVDDEVYGPIPEERLIEDLGKGELSKDARFWDGEDWLPIGFLLENNVSFSDGNAAVRTTKFYNKLSDFNNLNWTLINKGSWNHYEFQIKNEQKRTICAEVLTKDKIQTHYIDESITWCLTTKTYCSCS